MAYNAVARRPRHVRGSLASSLGTGEGVFISRVALGAVGRRVFHAAFLIFVLPSPINISTMSDFVNHNNLFFVKNLVDDAVIAYTEFVESC